MRSPCSSLDGFSQRDGNSRSTSHSPTAEPVHDAERPAFASSLVPLPFPAVSVARESKASKRALVPFLAFHLRLLALVLFQGRQETWLSSRRRSFWGRGAARRASTIFRMLKSILQHSILGRFFFPPLSNRVQVANAFA